MPLMCYVEQGKNNNAEWVHTLSLHGVQYELRPDADCKDKMHVDYMTVFCMYTTNGNKFIRKFRGHENIVNACTSYVNAKNETVIVSSSLDGSIRCWNPFTGNPIGTPKTISNQDCWPCSLTTYVDTNKKTVIVTISDVGDIYFWYVESNTPILLAMESENDDDDINCCALYQNRATQRMLVCANDNIGLFFWCIDQNKQLEKALNHNNNQNIICCTTYMDAAGKTVIVSGDDSGVFIRWDAESYEQIGKPLNLKIKPLNMYLLKQNNQLIIQLSNGNRVIVSLRVASLQQLAGKTIFENRIAPTPAQVQKVITPYINPIIWE